MNKNKCGIIMFADDVSSPGFLFNKNYEALSCILENGHGGVTPDHNDVHLIQTPSGKYIIWWHDDDCVDCDEGECECFISKEISAIDAEAVIAKGYWDKEMTKKLL